MKKLFCKMFLIFGLGLGFSVHSQEQESEWVTCNSSEACDIYPKSHIVNIEEDGDLLIISLTRMGPFFIDYKATCLKSDFEDGMNCRTIFGSPAR